MQTAPGVRTSLVEGFDLEKEYHQTKEKRLTSPISVAQLIVSPCFTWFVFSSYRVPIHLDFTQTLMGPA